jgi:hypothetical protein
MMLANNGNRKFGMASNPENRRAVPNAQIAGKDQEGFGHQVAKAQRDGSDVHFSGLVVGMVNKQYTEVECAAVK